MGNRYGFQRDELQTLDDARRLAWGYVAYPALTPLFGRLSLTLFGTWLRGFRFFASLAPGAALLISGLMARQLGGRRGAQVLTVFALLPAAIGAGMLMQYVASGRRALRPKRGDTGPDACTLHRGRARE